MPKEAKVKAPEVDTKKGPEVKEETVKAEVKGAAPKKEAAAPAKKAEPKKETPAKKPAAKAKKAAKEKAVMVPEIYIQYTDNGEQEASMADIVAKIKALYVAEGHRESSIKSLKIYMKPQEWKAYYVINNKIEGNIMIF